MLAVWGAFDVGDDPVTGVPDGEAPPRGQHADGVSAAHGAAGQLHGLGLVTLKHKTELAALGELAELSFQVCGQLWVGLAGLGEQVSQSRHGCSFSGPSGMGRCPR